MGVRARVPMAVLVLAMVPAVPAGAHGPKHAPAPASKPAITMPGKELVELRTRTSRAYERPDGSVTARVFAGPVNYRDGSGAWRAIDNTLKRDGAAISNVANGYDVRLPARLEDAPIGVSRGANSITLRPIGAQGEAIVRGNASTYLDAWPGADLAYAAHSESVKETILVRDAGAQASYAFELDTSAGLRPRRAAGGGLELLDADGRIAMTFAPAWMRDARGVGRRVTTSLQRDGAVWKVTLQASRRWLDAAERRFPVTIDPTVGISANPDCLLSNETGMANTTVCSEDFFEAGYGWAYDPHDHHGLLKFDVQSAVPAGADVLSARLNLHLRSSDTGVTKEIFARRVTAASNGSVSWNKRDGANAWTTPGGDMTTTNQAAATVNGSTPAWHKWYVDDMVDGWSTGRYANHGVMLVSADTDNVLGAMMFDSSEAADASLRPYLDVVYDRRLGERRGFTYERFRLSDRIDLAVNPGSGNLVVHNRDLTVPGAPGPDLSLSRTYNGLTETWGAFSRWWWDTGNDYILQWHPNGKVLVTGPSGYQVAFKKDASGNFVGREAGFDATITALPTSYKMVDHKTQTKRYFNSWGRLSKEEDRNGRAITYTYVPGDESRVASITDSKGRVTNITYEGLRIKKIVDPAGREYSYTYTDVLGWQLLTSYTDPAGGVTQYGYDSNRRLSQITTPGGRVTKINYYPTTHAQANKVKEIIRVTDPVAGTGPMTQFSYTPARDGSSTAVVTDPNSHVTNYEFDTSGRPKKVTDALGRHAKRTYTTAWNVDEYTAPGNTGLLPSTKQSYDGADNPTTLTTMTSGSAADDLKSELKYQAPSTVQGGQYLPTSALTEQDTASANPGASITYDNDGNPTQISKGNATITLGWAGAPNKGRLDSSTLASRTTLYGYDAKDNLTSVNPPAITGSTDLGTTTYAYTATADQALSRPTSMTDGRGNKVLYEYDAMDRVKKVTYKSPDQLQTEASFAYTYDLDGNLTQRVDTVGASVSTYGFTYDKLNRLTLESLPGPRTNTYTYDAASNLKTLADAGGTVTYNYDNINRQSSIQEPGAASPISFTYVDTVADSDPLTVDNGQKNTISLPNGVVTTNILDPAGRMLDTTSKNSGGTVLQRFAYQYKLANNKQQRLVSRESDLRVAGAQIDYTYDQLDRVTGAVNSAGDDFAYTYDGASNTATRAVNGGTPTKYKYNEGNQLCWRADTTADISTIACNAPPSGATVYTYDADGDQLTNVAGNQTATYNRRMQMATLAGVTYEYAGPGQSQRIAFGSTQVVNNILGVGSHTTAPDAAYLTRDENGTLLSQRRTPASAPNRRYYYLSDRQGSTRTLLDETGAVGRRFNYDPYGRDIAVSGTWTINTGFRWLGAEAGAGGIYRFGERWYDPLIGRWTQQDPKLHPADLVQANRYVYAGGNPLNATDPSGMGIFDDPTDLLRKGLKAAGKTVFKANGLVCYVRKSTAEGDANEVGDDIDDAVECFNPVSGYGSQEGD